MKKSEITIELLRKACLSKGYSFFEEGDFNLNIVGVRSGDMAANTFNDVMCVAFKLNGQWHLMTFDCTTDPGVYYRENPLSVDGTAVYMPGQHRGVYQIGKHKGKYPALVQRKRLPVWRDNNRDRVVDIAYPAVEYGLQGLNIHHAAFEGESTQVGKWSAGCQVFANYFEHGVFMALCRASAALYGNSFSYTLLEEADLYPDAVQQVA